MTNDELRMRVLKLKDRLPRKYTERLRDKFPKYKKSDLMSRVYKVVALQITDESITDDLEKICVK